MNLNCDKCGYLREKSSCCHKILPCKECANQRALDYYYRNTEKCREKQTEYYNNNKDKVLAKQKDYRDQFRALYNQKQRNQYHKRKIQRLMNRFEAMEVGVIG